MKGNRFLRILATAIILAMLIAVLPATPVLAAGNISVTPTSGEIDDYVEIYCTGFDTEENVYFYFSGEEADEGDEIGQEVENYERIALEYSGHDGSFEIDFDVPDELTDGDSDEDVESGDYFVYAADEDDEILAVDDFRVIVIGLSISPDEGPVGTEVRVTGSGFDDNEEIEIKFGSTTVDLLSKGDDETDNDGEFTSYFLVPETTEGDHTVTVEVRYDEAEAEFTVEPAIEIDPADGAVDDRILVSGTGFAYREDFTITFDGIEVGGDTTDGSGSFENYVNVPEVAAGEYEIEAEDDDNNSAKATFTISTDVSISPTTSANSPGAVGDSLTISGTGFKPSSEITITYTSDPVTFYTDSLSDGSFSLTFEVPPSQAGEHIITATDGVSSMSRTFYMESTSPAIPQPLLPYMNDKAKSLAYFDWEDVTASPDGVVEESLPITYELQIATDESFTNLLLDKKGLTTSEYTLTEEEALESSEKDAPYYWRIRAVDAASNASDWTGAGIFTVGFSFSFPDIGGWLLYLLIGVGALVLFFVGFWLGRRGGGGDYY
ncbi:hypothetical protein ES705_22111 [subsurface metagenome]